MKVRKHKTSSHDRNRSEKRLMPQRITNATWTKEIGTEAERSEKKKKREKEGRGKRRRRKMTTQRKAQDNTRNKPTLKKE
jgi:hypothetical protein